jgi:hypothetical protein
VPGSIGPAAVGAGAWLDNHQVPGSIGRDGIG